MITLWGHHVVARERGFLLMTSKRGWQWRHDQGAQRNEGCTHRCCCKLVRETTTHPRPNVVWIPLGFLHNRSYWCCCFALLRTSTGLSSSCWRTCTSSMRPPFSWWQRWLRSSAAAASLWPLCDPIPESLSHLPAPRCPTFELNPKP